MPMTNGAAPDMQPTPRDLGYQDMAPNIVTINLGLKARHFAMLFGAIVAAGGSLGTAGWLAMPAKQQDVEQLQVYHVETTANIKLLESNLARVESKMDTLTSAVLEIANRPPAPLPRRKPVTAAISK